MSSAANFPLDSDRMVSALKFAAFDYALGRSPRDWIEPFTVEGTSPDSLGGERP